MIRNLNEKWIVALEELPTTSEPIESVQNAIVSETTSKEIPERDAVVKDMFDRIVEDFKGKNATFEVEETIESVKHIAELQNIELSLESMKNEILSKSKISKQTARVVRSTICALGVRSGVKVSVEDIDGDPNSVRDVIEQVSTQTDVDTINEFKEQLEVNKLTAISKAMNQVRLKINEFLSNYTEVCLEVKKAIESLNRPDLVLDVPKNKTISLDINKSSIYNDITKRHFNTDSINSTVNEIYNSLIIIEHALEYNYTDESEDVIIERLHRITFGNESHEGATSDIRTLEFEVSDKGTLIEKANIFINAKGQGTIPVIERLNECVECIERIEHAILKLSEKDQIKNLRVLNKVIEFIHTSEFMIYPFNRLKLDKDILVKVTEIFMMEVDCYINEKATLSQALEEFKTPYTVQNVAGFAKNLMQAFLDFNVNSETVNLTSYTSETIMGLPEDYRAHLTYINHVIGEDKRNLPKIFNKASEDIKANAGVISPESNESVIESIKTNSEVLSQQSATFVKEFEIAEVDVPEIIIKETTIEPMSLEHMHEVKSACSETLKNLYDYLEEAFGESLNELITNNDGVIEPKLNADNVSHGIEGMDSLVVNRYINLVNKPIQSVIEEFFNKRKDFINYSFLILTAIFNWYRNNSK